MQTIESTFEAIKAEAQKEKVQVELLITGNERMKLGYQKRKLDKYEATQSQLAGFRVLNGASCGYAYTENLSEDGLKKAFKEALENARTIKKEGMPLELPIPKAAKDFSHLYKSETIPMERKHAIAKKLEERALDKDVRITHVPYSGFSEEESWIRVMNSNGVDQKFKQSYYFGYSYPLAKVGDKSKCDGETVFARTFDKINVESSVDEAVEKVIKLLSATPLKTGRFPAVLSREIVGDFLAMLMGYFSAKSVDKGNSLLAGKLNQKIASEKFSLIDDPFNENCTGVRPFDAEGCPSQTTTLFENGTFKSFLTNLEYSKKLNLPHTASASRSPSSVMGISVSNLVIPKGDNTLDQLFNKAPEMIYLTNIDGGLHAGFKEATGDFSLPAQAYLVKGGKIISAVDQFVVSGNILDLLTKVEGLGNTYNKPGSGVEVPDLYISELSFAGGN